MTIAQPEKKGLFRKAIRSEVAFRCKTAILKNMGKLATEPLFL
jgi:hypothetical protein